MRTQLHIYIYTNTQTNTDIAIAILSCIHLYIISIYLFIHVHLTNIYRMKDEFKYWRCVCCWSSARVYRLTATCGTRLTTSCAVLLQLWSTLPDYVYLVSVFLFLFFWLCCCNVVQQQTI